ncbi:alpha/beta fold hydrolase [Gorillibacterium sp. sgz5001074]|uniref:alpha/beta fold hydrolase n=1 Tax=Gorillibacterium sp. sgz5001074 TaxID=3446695 RepID=UPI003F66A32F
MPMTQVNGANLHYHVTGDGMPIVFVHPPILNQEIFNYQKAQLADRYKVVLFDVRGHGQSFYSKTPVKVPVIAEDMKQLLDELEIEQAVVCGYSAGSLIALEALLTYPERFVGGILVSGMSQMTDWVHRSRVRLASGLTRIKAKRLLGGSVGWTNADMNVTFNNLYQGAVNGHASNIHQYYRECIDYSCTDRLHAIKQPMLLMYGKNDVHYHAYAKVLDERLPNRDLIFINDVGHHIVTKAPRTMHRLLNDWMERHFTGTLPDSRWENFVQDVPDYLPDADTPTARHGMQEI